MRTLDIPGRGAFNFLMRNIMIRHSQAQKYTGTSTTLMSLPPKVRKIVAFRKFCVSDISSAFFNQTERVVTVKFSEREKKEYAALESVARIFYEDLVKSGGEIGRNYLKLTSQLLPLRVACAGGNVPLDDTNGAESEDEAPDSEVPKKRKKVQKFSDFAFTSKLKTLIAELEAVRTKDPTAKCLVFSQFTSTLQWLQKELPKHGFQYRTLSGDMSMRNRAMALQDFQNDPPTTIFLLSMRAGAVGINLTQANNVFLMEPCFNAAVTAQAVGRVSFSRKKRRGVFHRL
jgi:SNF2 family DNA or RNA helicase